VRAALAKLVDGVSLSEAEARAALDEMVAEDLDAALAAAVLTALRVKGETADEIRGFALRLLELAVRPPLSGVGAVDVVGTGGDGSDSLNLSTGAALTAAAAGAPVIKHGAGSVSSLSGSADVLAALGLAPPEPSEAGELFERSGFTFLFAPAYHPAMKSIAPVRRSLGIRTIFNIAGPLSNPARPPFYVIGAYSADMARTMAETLAGMSIKRAFVVHGAAGWDEPTPIGPYTVFETAPGAVTERVEDPAEFGFARCSPSDLVGGDAAHNARRLRDVFKGERGPHRDALILGASLALRVRGAEPEEAAARAAQAIDDGAALRLVESLKEARSD